MFRRHPFTAKDPLVSKWCYAKFLQVLDGLRVSTFPAYFHFGWTIPLGVIWINISQLKRAFNETNLQKMAHSVWGQTFILFVTMRQMTVTHLIKARLHSILNFGVSFSLNKTHALKYLWSKKEKKRKKYIERRYNIWLRMRLKIQFFHQAVACQLWCWRIVHQREQKRLTEEEQSWNSFIPGLLVYSTLHGSIRPPWTQTQRRMCSLTGLLSIDLNV